jgi:hypothetical protein
MTTGSFFAAAASLAAGASGLFSMGLAASWSLTCDNATTLGPGQETADCDADVPLKGPWFPSDPIAGRLDRL